MSTLLFPLIGPMQAWGISSNFVIRDTLKEPSKSGVIGLIASAMGLTKDSDLSEFRSLRFGVRVDKEGNLLVDFHTAKNVLNAEGSILKNAVISNRYYLADARFLIGLEGNNNLLERIHQALKSPKWLLFLGRKSFPLAEPAWFPADIPSIVNETLEDALTKFPWIGFDLRYRDQNLKVLSEFENFQLVESFYEEQNRRYPSRLRLLLEREDGFITNQDQPINYKDRLFTRRKVVSKLINLPTLSLIPKEVNDVSFKNSDQSIL